MPPSMKTLILICMVVLGSAVPVAAQVRFVDENGVVHWVGSPEQVPQQYRAQATQATLPPAQRAEGLVDKYQAQERLAEADRRLNNAKMPVVRPDTTAPTSQQQGDERFGDAWREAQRAEEIAKPREKEAQAFENASRICQASVNRGRTGSFRAVADGSDGYVSMIGTPTQQFAYEACMGGQKQPIRRYR